MVSNSETVGGRKTNWAVKSDSLQQTMRALQRKLRLAAAIAAGLAIAGFTPRSFATDGTWANPAVATPTLTTTTTGGVYTSSSTLAVGDAVTATASTGGLTNNRVYYVVAANAGSYTLSATPGGSAITGVTTSGTQITSNGILTWDATTATDTQSAASWNTVPSGTDATATVASDTHLGNDAVTIKNAVTIGTLNFSPTSNDLNLISSNNGTTTTLSALTFATSTGTPTINDTSSTGKVLRLGLNDASYGQGKIKINGTQGLVLNATQNSTTAGFIRIEAVDWSGFTNGSGGVGTLTLQSGNITTEAGNVLGSGTGALNLVIGNGSSSGGAVAPELALGNNADIQVNNLDGTSNGLVSGASRTLTIGAGNGTNVGFAGTIGQTAGGVNTNTNLSKIGSGTQTISGNIVSATGTVTVNGASGTLVLSGSGDSYGGTTTVTAGSLNLTGSLTGATAITVNGGTLSESSAGVIGSAAASLSVSSGTATLGGANSYTSTTAVSGTGTLNINNTAALGSGAFTISGGTIDNTSTAAVASQTNNPAITLGGSFAYSTSAGTASNNLNLGTGAVSMGADYTITLNGAGALTFGGVLTNTADSVRTLTVNNGTVTTSTSGVSFGGLALTGAGSTARVDIINGSGNATITGPVTDGVSAGSGLTYSGTGVLTLAGNDTYTSTTTVGSGSGTAGSASTLVLAGNNTSATGAVNVGNGATLRLTNVNGVAGSALSLFNGSTLQLRSDTNGATFTPASITQIPTSAAINFDVNQALSGSNATLNLAGAISVNNTGGSNTDTFNVTGGNGYTLGLGALTVAEGILNLNPTTANLAIASITNGSDNTNGSYLIETTGAGNVTFTGNITADTGKSLHLTVGTVGASTGSVTLSGTDSWNGANSGSSVTLNSGTLVLNSTSALGGNLQTLTIAGGTLDAGVAINTNPGSNMAQTWSGDFTFAGSNNLNLGTGAVTLSANRQVTVNASTLTVGGAIGDGSSGYSLTKAGNGVLALSGASTYGGGTTINAGTLTLAPSSGTNNVSASKYINVGSGSFFNVTAVNGTTNNSFALKGTGTQSTSQILGGSGTVTGAVAVANGATLSAGTNSGGATVTGGTGTVPATGSANSVGALSTGALTFGAGGNFAVKISDLNADSSTGVGNPGTAGANYDTVAASGAIKVTSTSGSGFNVQLLGSGSGSGGASANFDAGANYKFQLASYTSTTGLTHAPTTNGATEILTGASADSVDTGKFVLDTSNFTTANPTAVSSDFFLEAVGTGSGAGDLDVVYQGYSAAPEPGTAMLVLAGAMPMLTARRRRKRVNNAD
jgi:autotransporter-associated beta strand protein